MIVTLVVLLLSSNLLAYFYTDLLWFQEVGLTSVLWKSLGTQVLVGVIVGAVNLWLLLRRDARAALSA